MTVTYTHEVANARLGGFSNLLLRWRGSVYKVFYKEFLIYIALYSVISAVYRCINIPEFRESFEKLCMQFQSYTDLVPISFVLGFYVSMVVGRWWCQYENIPWPDTVMLLVASNVHGSDNRGRLIRRTLLRYVNLAQVLTYRSISTAVYKRFPTIQHVIDAGFMSEAEHRQYKNVKTQNVKYWVPFIWFANLLSKVRQEGRIYDDMTYHAILKAMNTFRSCCGMLFSYDWISIPLVYTQVVTVAVYVYFMSTLLSRQYLDVTKDYPGHEVDLYVPIFTICQFFFYVGWLKVAEQLINPFGEDDDDFEVNWVIDRNLELSMLSVDNMYMNHPKLEKDRYWNNPNPSIPYTAASVNHKMEAFLGSTFDMSLDPEEIQLIENGQKPNSEPNSKEMSKYDCNHNVADFSVNSEQVKLLHVPPRVEFAEPWKKTPEKFGSKKIEMSLAASIKRHFMNRSQEKDREAKKSLLSVDSVATKLSNHNSNASMKDVKLDDTKGRPDDDTPSTDPESDDGESDVGDGSEDDDLNDSVSQRRSSLSSEDETEKDGEDNVNESSVSLSGKKHPIEDPEDRPTAKKPRSSTHLVTGNPIQKILPNKAAPKTTMSKSRRPDRLIPSEYQKINQKNLLIRGKKSPKKRTSLGKFLKQPDFRFGSDGETEQERRNAQTRTLGLLRSSRKKSVTALQRNARRTHYPGNAWLRQQYPLSWKFDGPRTPMTSGAEELNKHGNDSPFGSVLSFGTSIPSPKPLRFSYNSKRGRNLRLDSPSASSCLPSPSVCEDYGCSPQFDTYGSPQSRPENLHWISSLPSTSPTAGPPHSTSMPFTEELRRRLLVVHTNTPSSSTATSPVSVRSQLLNLHHHNPFISVGENYIGAQPESDNLLMIAPYPPGNVTFSPWRENLEAIGENPTVEKETESTCEDKQNEESENEQTQSSESQKKVNIKNDDTSHHGDSTSVGTPKNKVILSLKSRAKRHISRSKSCSDVPFSKSSNAALKPDDCDVTKKPKIGAKGSEVSSDDDDNVPENDQKQDTSTTIQKGSKSKLDSPETTPSPNTQVHWENECNEIHHRAEQISSLSTSNIPQEIAESKLKEKNFNDEQVTYNTLSQHGTNETTPLLLAFESDDQTSLSNSQDWTEQNSSNKSDRIVGVSSNTNGLDDMEACLEEDKGDRSLITIDPTDKTSNQEAPVSTDQGYYSSKEENEGLLANRQDAFMKIRDVTSYPSVVTGPAVLSGQLKKLSRDDQNNDTRKNSKAPRNTASDSEHVPGKDENLTNEQPKDQNINQLATDKEATKSTSQSPRKSDFVSIPIETTEAH